jgi:hypothetical protein
MPLQLAICRSTSASPVATATESRNGHNRDCMPNGLQDLEISHTSPTSTAGWDLLLTKSKAPPSRDTVLRLHCHFGWSWLRLVCRGHSSGIRLGVPEEAECQQTLVGRGSGWCRGRESKPYDPCGSQDFKTLNIICKSLISRESPRP